MKCLKKLLGGKMEISNLGREEKGKFMQDLMTWDNHKLSIEANKKLQEYKQTGYGRYFVEYYLLHQILLFNHKESSFFNDIKFPLVNEEDVLNFLSSAPALLQNYFFNGKIFSMSPKVYGLLKNTKNKVFLRKHPFSVFAIEQKVETKFTGLNILSSIFFEVGEESKPIGCNYLILGLDERDNSEFWLTGTVSKPLKEYKKTEYFSKEESMELHLQGRMLYANFLDYLNHPSAKQSFYKLSWNNEKRIKKGKFPKQDEIIIDIRPDFLHYINLKGGSKKSPYKNKFWVRGHFKHFRNKIRFKRIYSLEKKELLEKENLFYNGEFISKWIVPYIKGSGEIKERMRRIK
jgi:hypothetical protein